jgi:uncharacterized cysteine cluster protein YcgN (CxxCxxCC family)
VPDCLTIYPNWGKKFLWLPTTCAYRLLSENKPLFDWHPLISGDVNSVHLAGISVRGRTYRDDEIPQEEVYKHVKDSHCVRVISDKDNSCQNLSFMAVYIY